MSSPSHPSRSVFAFALIMLLGIAYGGCLGDDPVAGVDGGDAVSGDGTSGEGGDGTIILLGGDGDGDGDSAGDGDGDGDGDSAGDGDGDGDSIDVVSSNGG